jgi:hypothetical protein
MIKNYLKEIRYLKYYILTIALVFTFGYLFWIFGDTDTTSKLGKEDHFIETMTAVDLLIASVFSFIVFFKTRNIFILIIGFGLFIGAGEEISWGQRIFNYNTPEVIKERNVQGEVSIHNLEIFDSYDSQHNYKFDLKRFLTINLLSKIVFVFCGIILPFCVYHIRIVSKITTKIKFPVPPVSIGIFFLFNWIMVRIICPYFILGRPGPYYASFDEFFEFMQSCILLTISYYFFRKWKIIIWGEDIKQFA